MIKSFNLIIISQNIHCVDVIIKISLQNICYRVYLYIKIFSILKDKKVRINIEMIKYEQNKESLKCTQKRF